MFFVMRDHVENGKTIQNRVGVSTTSYKEAVVKATKARGYIIDEHRKLIAQAVNPSLPKYVGKVVDVSSGEDCFV